MPEHSSHGKRSDRRPKPPRSKTNPSSSRGSSSRSSHPLSFLFVVNEFIIDFDQTGRVPPTDDWCNVLPPDTSQGFVGEICSKIMRYRDGTISEARGYVFGREPTPAGYPKAEGVVWARCTGGEDIFPDLYSSFSVFSCNPLLPIIVAKGDMSTYDDETLHPMHLQPLQFFHPQSDDHLRGVSKAAIDESPMGVGPGLAKYAAGVDASWIPSLVPETYRNPLGPLAPASRGIAGELPIVLGLMAFSEAGDPRNHTNRVNETFLGRPGHQGRWRDRRWTHNRRPAGYPMTTMSDPRGFFVGVFLDPENPEGSTAVTLEDFEWDDIIVKDS